MAIAFDCPACGRSYAVAESLAGKRVKCKDCGEPMNVPAARMAAKAAPPDVITFDCPDCGRKYHVAAAMAGKRVRCKSCGSELHVPDTGDDAAQPAGDDLYGLADLPPAPTSAATADALPPPSRPKWNPGKTSRSVGQPPQSDLVRTGLGIMGFGAFAVVLPFFGLTLGRHGAGLPPEATTAVGILCLVVGGIVAGIGALRGR
jgi:predicted Zn finger-like uncharacterized protein